MRKMRSSGKCSARAINDERAVGVRPRMLSRVVRASAVPACCVAVREERRSQLSDEERRRGPALRTAGSSGSSRTLTGSTSRGQAPDDIRCHCPGVHKRAPRHRARKVTVTGQQADAAMGSPKLVAGVVSALLLGAGVLIQAWHRPLGSFPSPPRPQQESNGGWLPAPPEHRSLVGPCNILTVGRDVVMCGCECVHADV
jgi:hypothetical protein